MKTGPQPREEARGCGERARRGGGKGRKMVEGGRRGAGEDRGSAAPHLTLPLKNGKGDVVDGVNSDAPMRVVGVDMRSFAFRGVLARFSRGQNAGTHEIIGGPWTKWPSKSSGKQIAAPRGREPKARIGAYTRHRNVIACGDSWQWLRC